MKLHRRKFLHLAAGATALSTSSRIATAQTYPSRPITIIVPYAAGGPTDTLARILGDHMKSTLGQPIIFENVAGATGSIAVGRVVQAPPNGYAVSIGTLGTHVFNGAMFPLKYNLLGDLDPVSLLPGGTWLIVSNNAVPAKNLAELIVWAKANPGKASFGTPGVGSVAHVAGIQFGNLTGARLQFVPYRGAAPALQDLVAGQIDMTIGQPITFMEHVRAGKLRAYAVTAKTPAIHGLNRFAKAVGLVTETVPYDRLVATQFRQLWND